MILIKKGPGVGQVESLLPLLIGKQENQTIHPGMTEEMRMLHKSLLGENIGVIQVIQKESGMMQT